MIGHEKYIFVEIDNIFTKVDQFRIDPAMQDEIDQRNSRKVPDNLTDDQLLKVFVTLIFFSQNANSKLVKQLIHSNVFDAVFKHFSIDLVSEMDGDEFIEEHWTQKRISVIRFKSKIFQIIKFAKKIKAEGSLATLLIQTQIPRTIKSRSDIEGFWNAFKILQSIMKERSIPFLQSTTTLLHYLLDTGYDCAKPDLVVMKVAREIDIVKNEAGDANFRRTIKVAQEYALSRGIRPSIVDLYFLITGGQKAARELVRSDFYQATDL